VQRTVGQDAEIGPDAVVGPFVALEPGGQVPANARVAPFTVVRED
jgi:bifunctional N-acetylglucosamine-1-phosphate-uridyltransferase/glucosamine-1-phosphate-acetyltransferase GlmU-like protein